MMGADFSNGFTIGEIGQKYYGNSLNEGPKGPIFETFNHKGKYGIDFKAKNADGAKCQDKLSYKFFGPKGEIGNLADYYKYASANYDLGEYRVIATDNLGCSTEHKFYPNGKEENTSILTRELDSEDIMTAFESSIYPNPSQEILI
jgi:hypothetical protein